MPGSPLNLDLPTIADSSTVIVTKLINAFNVVKTDLEAKVIPSEIDWVSTMNARTQPLINVSYLHLAQGVSTTAGSLYYLDGELWVVTQAGAVKVTQGGLLNTGATGTVDYGGSATARITYNSIANEFRGTQEPGIWATWCGLSFKIQGSGGGSVNISAAAAVTGATSKVLTNPPASPSYLVEDASGNVTPVTTVSFATTHSANITMSGGARIKHGDLSQAFGPYNPVNVGGGTFTITSSGISTAAAGQCLLYWHLPVVIGKRLKAVHFRINKAGTGISTVHVYSKDATGALSASLGTNTSVSVGLQNLNVTLGTPLAVASDLGAVAFYSNPTGQTDSIFHAEFTYDEI